MNYYVNKSFIYLARYLPIFGVQWHPEYRVLDDAFSTKLFAAFGAAARRRAEARANGDLAPQRAPGAQLTA